MILLEELEARVEKEKKDNPQAGEEDEIVVRFQKAARELLLRQVLHADDSQKTHYQIIARHRSYFKALMASFGYELTYDSTYQYFHLKPGQMDVESNRGKFRKDETILLFALRIMWEEGSRDGEMDEFGRIVIDTNLLLDRYMTLGGGEIPATGRVKDILNRLADRRFIRFGDEDKEEEIMEVIIMPVITELVSPDLARQVMEYAADPITGNPEGETVIENLEAQRVAAEEAAAEALAAEKEKEKLLNPDAAEPEQPGLFVGK